MKTEMTQVNKDLLLKDLCARLPYRVKASYYGAEEGHECVDVIDTIFVGESVYMEVGIGQYCLPIEKVKPYLFPLESMTEEQKKEFVKFACYEPTFEDCGRHVELYYYDLVGHENDLYPNSDSIDWLNVNHFDYRGLIEKGLAINAIGKNIY